MVNFIGIFVYLLLSLLVSASNTFISLGLCGGPTCPVIDSRLIFGALIILESLLISYLTGRRFSAFLGTSPYLATLMFTNFMTLSRGFGNLAFNLEQIVWVFCGLAGSYIGAKIKNKSPKQAPSR
jgi:hypothetical protein